MSTRATVAARALPAARNSAKAVAARRGRAGIGGRIPMGDQGARNVLVAGGHGPPQQIVTAVLTLKVSGRIAGTPTRRTAPMDGRRLQPRRAATAFACLGFPTRRCA